MTQRDNELISAYLDGELTDSERSRFESQVLPEPDAEPALAAYRQIGERMSNLPQLRLPADFHQQVIAAAEASPAAVETAPLRRRILTAVATMVAVVLLIIVSVWQNPAAGPGPERKMVDGAPDQKGKSGASGSSKNVSVEPPRYVFIVDVSISQAGQKSKPVEAILKQQEVFFDQDLRPTEELEQKLLNSRFVGKFDAAKRAPKARLIYVEMNVAEVNEFYLQLKSRPREVDLILFNFSKQPKEMHMFERLRRSAAAQFAAAPPRNRAWRIRMGVPIQSKFVIGASISPLDLLKEQLKKETGKGKPSRAKKVPQAKLRDQIKRPILFIVHPTPASKP